MTNIFNKRVLVNNGTLIGNWYEEEVLKNATGEGRKHIPKKFMKIEEEIKNPWPVEETSHRTMGEPKYNSFSLTSLELGNFPNLHEKYQTKGTKEEHFGGYLNTHIQLEKEKTLNQENAMKTIRQFSTSNKNQYNSQPVDYNNLGRRLMKTQDATNVQLENIDKNFMALHKMSKYPSIVSTTEVEGYLDKTVPHYKDKEITFWSSNLNKGNVYSSFQKGQNSFGRSSGYAQPIHNTKSVEQFSGNVSNSVNSNFAYLNEEDTKFMEKFNNSIIRKNQPLDLTANIKVKLFRKFSESWITLRKLRKYFKNLNRKSDLIDSSNFKYFLVNFGIDLDDLELKFIFEKFDTKRNNHINYNEFLDSITNFNLERQNLVRNFYSQVKNKSNENISFLKLVNLIKPDLHPEVIKLTKSGEEMRQEFLTGWINLKDDDIVLEENFKKFYIDISTCIENENDFLQCLESLGYQS